MKKVIKLFSRTVTVLVFLVVFGTVFARSARAQVVINEISPNDEWVELYNFTSSEVNLDGYILSMGSDSQKITFSTSDTMGENAFKIIQKGITPGWNNSNWLDNTSDSVTLKKPSDSDETISYGSGLSVCTPGDGKSIGRYPDSSSTIERLGEPTPGSVNKFDISTSCNPPTATPTSSPTSSSTPTPSPTPTPTPTPKPTPTKTPTPKPTSTSDATAASPQSGDAVLGLREQLNQESDGESSQDDGKAFPFLAVFLIIIGALFMGLGVYSFYKQKKGVYWLSERRKNV